MNVIVKPQFRRLTEYESRKTVPGHGPFRVLRIVIGHHDHEHMYLVMGFSMGNPTYREGDGNRIYDDPERTDKEKSFDWVKDNCMWISKEMIQVISDNEDALIFLGSMEEYI